MAAGLATIDVLENTPVYAHIDKLGEQVRTRLGEIFERERFPAQTTGIGSLFAIHMTDKKPLRDANCHIMEDHDRSRKMFSFFLDNGILMLLPETLHGAISHSHSESDIEQLVNVIERYVKEKR
jgi:glutamate-1-semialdehyde 2,1-aminomutase